MKWRLALRIATSPSERCLMKAAEWNPELSSKYKAYRAMVRRRRWEDGINELSNLKRMRPKTLLKVTPDTTNHGSNQQKTVKLHKKYTGKEYFGEAVVTGYDPIRPRRNRKIHVTDPDLKRYGNRSGRIDELRCLPHFSSCCLLGSPGSLRFVAQNPRIPATSNSVNLFQQQPVFASSLRVFFFVFDVTTQCHQRKSHQLQQTLFRGVMTPSFSLVRLGRSQLLDGLL